MAEGGGGGMFPVIFYDGERDINIGDIKIHSTLGFKTFQLMISQRIGISPNQITIYHVDRTTGNRIPITAKTNFGLLIRQKNIFFQAILKRSRKSRSRKPRYGGDYGDNYLDGEYSPPSLLENVILLRRNQPELSLGYRTAPFYDQITQTELAGLNDKLQNLKIQRENYALAMGKQPGFSSGLELTHPYLDPNLFPEIRETMTKNVEESGYKVDVCEACVKNSKKKDETSSFHLCVNDPVIRFRCTRAGPIAPPGKTSP